MCCSMIFPSIKNHLFLILFKLGVRFYFPVKRVRVSIQNIKIHCATCSREFISDCLQTLQLPTQLLLGKRER